MAHAKSLEVPLTRSLIVAVALALPALVLAPGVASAQEEICSGALTHEAWQQKMDAADQRLASFAPDEAAAILEALKKEIPCLDTVARPSHLGRYARQMAIVAFFEQDEIMATRWGQLQQSVAPNLPWPADFGEDHPLRSMLALAEAPPLAGPDDKGLVFPKKGAVFMNGAVLEQPKARAEVPNLIQIADKSGVIVQAYWQDGAAFREEILGEPGVVATAPKWFVPEDPSAAGSSGALFGSVDGVASVDTPEPEPEPSHASPDPEPEPVRTATRGGGGGPKIGQLLVGGGLGLVAGSLYAVGGSMRGGLDAATTEDELVSARSRVNLMVFGAGAAAAAGLGVGMTAFVGADGGGLRWTWKL